MRAILDSAGLTEVRIFASSNLDEDSIAALVGCGAPIDGFGVGTRMNTSADQPYLDCAYKLQEYAGRPCRKRSEGKATLPGRKQVFRRVAPGALHRELAGDTLGLANEEQLGTPLLQPVMASGRRLAALPSLAESREYARAQLATLPPMLRQLEPRNDLAGEVELSAGLLALARRMDELPAD